MSISRSISLEDLGEQLSAAKSQLAHEKKEILKQHRLPRSYNREEYVFSYLRAERVAMQAIHARLAEIAWLPMQLDPQSELVADNRAAMKRWLTGAGGSEPAAEDFGNDFVHAVTRATLLHGWDGAVSKKTVTRTARLFHDLSCLIGMIYYTTWLAEHEVEGIALSDPEDLYMSVVEMAGIVQSPELHKALKQRAAAIKQAEAKRALEKSNKMPPFLKLVYNAAYADRGFARDPLPV